MPAGMWLPRWPRFDKRGIQWLLDLGQTGFRRVRV